LQEILYRALERDPRIRYASARDFARDLTNPEQVRVEERMEMREWNRRQAPLKRRMLSYVMLALVPVVLFGMLLYAARH
jgi:serine/threonine-protein kinase